MEGHALENPLVELEPRETQTGLVLLLHGRGDTAYGMKSLGEAWAKDLPHVRFVIPTAPTFLEPSGLPHCSWYATDARGKMFGHEQAWCQLLKFIHGFLKLGQPLSRVVFVGFSMGSVMASWVALQLPVQCGGLIMLSGGIRPELQVRGTARQTSVLYSTGAADSVVTPSVTRECAEQLRPQLSNFRYVELPNQGHIVSDEQRHDVLAFLQAALPPEAAKVEPREVEAHTQLLQTEIEGLISIAPKALNGRLPVHPEIEPGAEVVLQAPEEFRGQPGKIQSFDAAANLFQVECSSSAEPLVLRLHEFVQRLQVQLLQTTSSHEGASPEVDLVSVCLASDGGVEAYLVEVPDGTETHRPDKVRLFRGAVVRLGGLTSERGKRTNGQLCVVGPFLPSECRYEVMVEAEDHPLRVRPRNLIP